MKNAVNFKVKLDLRRYFVISMPWFTCPEDNVIIRGWSLLLPEEAYDTLQRKEQVKNKTTYTQCDSCVGFTSTKLTLKVKLEVIWICAHTLLSPCLGLHAQKIMQLLEVGPSYFLEKHTRMILLKEKRKLRKRPTCMFTTFPDEIILGCNTMMLFQHSAFSLQKFIWL